MSSWWRGSRWFVGFVENQQLGLLGQRPGEQDPLAFTTGLGGQRAVGEPSGAGAVQGVGDDVVAWSWGSEPVERAQVRGPAQGDRFQVDPPCSFWLSTPTVRGEPLRGQPAQIVVAEDEAARVGDSTR